MRQKTQLFLGIFFSLIGILFLLKTLNIFSFEIWQGFITYWPVGLILAGIALIYRQKALSSAIIMVTIIFAIFFVSGNTNTITEKYVKTIPFENNMQQLDLNLDFGAGDFKIKGGKGYLLNNIVNTSSGEPDYNIDNDNGNVKLEIQRNDHHWTSWNVHEEWDISIDKIIPTEINLDYGAAKGEIDLRELNVNILEIDSGASDTTINFGSNPMDVKIDTGASKLKMYFPKDANVKIMIDGGALTTDFKGFEKKNGIYYSENFVETNIIFIDIDAGASTIIAEVI